MFHRKKSKTEAILRRKFTLLELLITIAIITILAALLLPVLNAARKRAYNTACVSNQKQILSTLHQYADISDDYFPSIITDATTSSSYDYWQWTRIWQMVYPSKKSAYKVWQKSIFNCPAAQQVFGNFDRPCHYAINTNTHTNSTYVVMKHCVKRNRVKQTTQTMLTTEGRSHFVPIQSPTNIFTKNAAGRAIWEFNHNDGNMATIGYYDGHAGQILLSTAQYYKASVPKAQILWQFNVE